MSTSYPIVVASTSVSFCMFWLLVPVAIFCIYRGYKLASRKLLLEHTPTTDCGGVSPGRVELTGEAVSENPAESPLTDRKVVYYEYKIEERREDSSGDKEWKKVASGTHSAPFYLHDDTGRVRVNPQDADFHPDTVVDSTVGAGHPLYDKGPTPRASARRRRFEEKHIAIDQDLYIFGAARSRQGLGVPEIYAGDGGDPYVISTSDEGHLVDKYGRQSTVMFWIGGLTATALPILGTMVLSDLSFGEAFATALVPTFVIGLGIAGMLWALYRMKHSEFLTDLQKRMEQAEAIMRRELHHRERLAAQLVNAARLDVGYSDRKKLDAVADRRKQEYQQTTFNNVRRMCPCVDAQSEALQEIFDIIADYDEFGSDEDFYELLEELTRCEKQIMMARNFYNDAAWRLQQQPESMVGDTRSTAGLTFQRFENKPVDVVLPEDPDDEYGIDDLATPPTLDEQAGDRGDESRQRSTSDEGESTEAVDDDSTRIEVDDEIADVAEEAVGEVAAEQGEAESRRDGEVPDQTMPSVPDEEVEPVPEETPSFEPETDAFSSTMDFGNTSGFDEIGNFDDVGEFGATRSFDDRSGDEEDSDDAASSSGDEFGFGANERGSLAGNDWESDDPWSQNDDFGFDDEEKGVLDAFDEDDDSPPKETR